MAVDLPDKIRKAIEGPQFWALATTNPDGSPQVSTVWVKPKDGNILVNSALGRKKPRNLEHEPRVALSWHGATDSGYESYGIQGIVGRSEAMRNVLTLVQHLVHREKGPDGKATGAPTLTVNPDDEITREILVKTRPNSGLGSRQRATIMAISFVTPVLYQLS